MRFWLGVSVVTIAAVLAMSAGAQVRVSSGTITTFGGSSTRIGPTAVAAAPCSRATAARLGRPYLWDPLRFQRQQIVQLLCGPFTGPGSTAMVMSFRAPTCWGEQGWAMFRHVGGAWRLVKVQRGTFLFPFIVVDNDIQENSPAFRRGDSRCTPSGGRQGRIWHWNGKRLAPAPAGWMLLTLGRPDDGGGDLYSPLPGRIYCAINDGNEDEFNVYCGSETLGHTVKLELNGQTSVCTNNCQVARPPWNLGPARLPIGQNLTFRHFRCASQQTGVLCTVIASGKGFLINSTGITRVG